MDYGKRLEKLMAMDDASWERHANPLSGWTRIPILPLLALAIWSRVWIGWWCVLPIVCLLIWTWLNPRAFSVPKSTDNWMSEAVMGERVWLARKEVSIANHHAKAAAVLNLCAATGIPFLVYGLYALHFWSALFGVIMVLVFKLWFLDRMVWLYRDGGKSVKDKLRNG